MVWSQSGGGTTVSKNPKNTIFATNAPMATGIARFRWFFQMDAINTTLTAESIQTTIPAVNADKPAWLEMTI